MRNWLVMLALAALMSGCRDADKPTANRDDSLVTVSGHVLTKEKADRMLAAQLAVTRGSKVRAQNALAKGIDKKFVMDCVMRDYAKANGIAVDPKEIGRQTRRLLSRNRNLATNLVSELEKMVRNDLTAKKVYGDFVARQEIEIPAAEVRRRREIFERINRDADATNAVIRARAKECWRRMVKGELSFAKALELYDESEGEKDPEGNWGEFALDAFPEEEALLRGMLATMRPGDITQPVPGDNGLVIVKLLGTGVNANDPSGKPAKTYRLARVFFHLYETCEAQSDAELEGDLRNIEMRERWGRFVDGLTKEAAVAYPNGGENLRVWKSNNTKEKEARK